MMLSMIAVPLAFSGVAAANQPTTADTDFDRQANNPNERLYQGQVVTFDADTTSFSGLNQVDLFTTSRDDNNDRVLDSFVQLEDVEPSSNGGNYVKVDTGALDAGSYSLSTGNEGGNVENGAINFTVTEQTVNAEFKSDSATDSGADSEVVFEVSSDQRNVYAINVSADGLDYEDLVKAFNQSGAAPGLGTELNGINNRTAISQAGASPKDYAGRLRRGDHHDLLRRGRRLHAELHRHRRR